MGSSFRTPKVRRRGPNLPHRERRSLGGDGETRRAHPAGAHGAEARAGALPGQGGRSAGVGARRCPRAAARTGLGTAVSGVRVSSLRGLGGPMPPSLELFCQPGVWYSHGGGAHIRGRVTVFVTSPFSDSPLQGASQEATFSIALQNSLYSPGSHACHPVCKTPSANKVDFSPFPCIM